MIHVRKLLTKETFEKFNKTNILTDLELIAYLDTYEAIGNLTNHRIFSTYFVEAIQHHQSFGLREREKRIIIFPEFKNPIIINDEEVVSRELFDRFINNEWFLNLEEIKLISNHFWYLARLTEFDPTHYLILNEWIMYKTELLTKISISKRYK